jgi:hypothetical protein
MMPKSAGPTTRGDSEHGAIAVLVAITLTVLLLLSAFVLDLGALRADRVGGKAVADMAAAAAVVDYLGSEEGEPRAACQRAIEYVDKNLRNEAPLQPVNVDGVLRSCEDLFAETYACAPGDVNDPAVYETGDYRVHVTIPVEDDDFLMGDEHDQPDFDGDPCERVGVQIVKDRSFLLAPVGGIDGGSTQPGSVGRAFSSPQGEPASLIVLEDACEAMRVNGGGTINVNGIWTDDNDVPLADQQEGEDNPDDYRYHPGVITVDSDASSCYLFVLNGSNPEITSDFTFSYALDLGYPDASVYPDHDGLDPKPVAGNEITRSPVDYRFNCLASYPSGVGAPRWSPNHDDSVSNIGGCSGGDGEPYVQRLHLRFQSMTASDVATNDDWVVIGDDATPGMPTNCNGMESPAGGFGPHLFDEDDDKNGKNWFVNCPGVNNNGFRPNSVTFENVENIVTQGRISLQSSDLTINGNSDSGSTLYLKAGSLHGNAQAEIDFDNTFVYVESGPVNVAGGADIRWHTLRDGNCADPAVPNAACFGPLALWTNAYDEHNLGGNGLLDISGTFFTPNASPFKLHGGGAQSLDAAQFFAGTFLATGGGDLNMVTDPGLIPVEVRVGSGLIR